jgi:hypothetical protein
MSPPDFTSLRKLQHIRTLISVFIVGLVVSGLTAFPIQTELIIANGMFEYFEWDNNFSEWIYQTCRGVVETNTKYPFIAYGTDWLAFAHLVLAILFIGPFRDPVKNIWVVEFGLITCILIFPLAIIAGHFRAIPIYWRLIDCSFGFFGGILLLSVHRKIKHLERNLVRLSAKP